MRCHSALILQAALAVSALLLLWILLRALSTPRPKCHLSPDATPIDYRAPAEETENISALTRTLTAGDIPRIGAENVTCARIFANDEWEYRRARYAQNVGPQRSGTAPLQYVSDTQNCARFRSSRGYAAYPGSAEEAKFPIAFSLMIYRDIDQFERLLRVMYRPQNVYCIHVDVKAPVDFIVAAGAIAGCFENVFLSSRMLEVKWGEYSVLEADLTCMEDLWARSKRWKYLINLTGQEWPLRTHAELVKVLAAYNGSNNIEGTVLRMSQEFRAYIGAPPCGVRLTKGSMHIVASRAFVHYVLHSPVARALRDWLRTVSFPDEMFFSSLNHSPHLGVPGAYTGVPETDTTTYRFLTRYKNWGDPPFDYPCPGRQWTRQICVLSLGDLPRLAARPELFANKFVSGFHPLALDCMEELIHNRTRDELEGRGRKFDVKFYQGQDFVKNHV